MQDKKTKRKRLLIMLPLFLLPIAGILAIFLSGKPDEQPNASTANAFNANLPSAHIKDAGKNKLEIYMQAEKDSTKTGSDFLSDPYGKNSYDPAPAFNDQYSQFPKSDRPFTSQAIDPNVKKVNDRLDKLVQEINQPLTGPQISSAEKMQTNGLEPGEMKELEKMIQAMQASGNDEDPEIKRLEMLLQKVIDIQHPDRVDKKEGKETNIEEKRVSVHVTPDFKDSTATTNAFFPLNDEQDVTAVQDKTTILAMVHENQTIREGSTIKLRLMQDIFIGESYIPKGNFISGTCQFSGDRIIVQFRNIAYKNIIYPVSLTVFDIDGLLGINVPGSMTREATKQGMGQAVQDIQISDAGNTLATQAANTGIETLKTIFSKKVKRIQANVTAGHRLLLKNSNL